MRSFTLSLAAVLITLLAGVPAVQAQKTPTVSSATHVSTSEPLRSMRPIPHKYRSQAPFVVPERFPYRFDGQPIPPMRPGLVDPVLDAPAPSLFEAAQGTVLSSFTGTPAAGTAPPDPTGEIGPDHFVQMVNSRLAVYNRAGALLLGPVNNNQIWVGAGGLCEVNNDGDPIVLYDETANRWLISQFVSATGPDAMCVAISTTPDPTGSWHRYEFGWPEGFPDYPKFGVWPTGYALTTSLFPDAGGSFSQAVMLERDQMLVGAAAQSIRFTLNDGTVNEYYSMLPADFDGPAPPPGTPALFAGLRLASGTPADREVIRLYTLTPDWATPANSTLNYLGGLTVSPFDVYALFSRSTAIPQLGTADRVAGLGHRPMMRLQYRNFGGTGRLLFNHTIAVNDGPPTRTGVRWYELRDGGTGTWSLYQEGTYAPSDGLFRWVGSMAMNDAGDIGLAYSVSSSTIYPSVRFTGQTAAEGATASGVMDITETEILAGTGSQVGTGNRWGDYSHLSVDPADGTTFWYTNEHYETTSSFNWRTNISHFSLIGIDDPIFSYSPGSISVELETDEMATRTVTINNDAAPGAATLAWSAEVQYLTEPLTSGGDTSPSSLAVAPEANGSGLPAPQTSGVAETEGPSVRAVPAASRSNESAPVAEDKAAVLCSDGQVIEQTTSTSNFNVSTTNEYGQSFVAPCSGIMTSVVPTFLGTGSGNFESILRLYNGLGVLGTVLATVPNTTATPASGFYEIDYTFPSPVEVVEGQTYTWFVDIVSGTTAMSLNTGNPYPDGSRWRSTSGNVSDAFATSGDMRYRGTFSPANPWASLSVASGTVAPGASAPIDVLFDATDLANGTYTADIVITTNDPATPAATVPLTLVVGGTAPGSVVLNGNPGWYLMGYPGNGGAPVDHLATLNLVAGVPGYYPTFFGGTPAPTLMTGYSGSAWLPSAGTGETVPEGEGFLWYFFDNDFTPTEPTDNPSSAVSFPVTLTTSGAINTGDATVELSADGNRINALGNPFGTPLDVTDVRNWPGGNQVASKGRVFIWDPNLDTWLFDDDATTVEVWQGFAVRAKQNADGVNLTIPASAASGAPSANATPEADTRGEIAFTLEGTEADTKRRLQDRALRVTFGDDGASGWDDGDAEKFAPLAQAYVVLGALGADENGGTVLKAADNRALTTGSFEVPLALETAGAESALTLRWPTMQNLPAHWEVSLRDVQTGETVDLRRERSYAFTAASSAVMKARSTEVPTLKDADASGATTRFVLRVVTGGDAVALEPLALSPVRPNPIRENALVAFTLPEADDVTVTVLDVRGREVARLVSGSMDAGRHEMIWAPSSVASGVYVIRLATGDAVLTRRAVVVR